jgi:hypothetical protein
MGESEDVNLEEATPAKTASDFINMTKEEIALLIRPALNQLSSNAAAEGPKQLDLAADVVICKPMEAGADASQQSVVTNSATLVCHRSDSAC